jgi:hypothetical protein
MRYHGIFTLLACSAVLGGCGGDETQATSGTSSTGTPGEAANALVFHTGEFEAPPGDSFECFYTDTITEKELNAVYATAVQGPGGHHVTVYYSDIMRKPQHHPCIDAEMTSLRQIGAGGPEGAESAAEGLVRLPDGLAIKVPAGKQIVVQSHYINTTGAVEKVNDSITLHLVEDKDVKAYANYHVIENDEFEVPPQGTLSAQRTCTLDQDLDVVVLLGHMHEAGKHFRLERADGEGKPFEMLYDHDWQPQNVSHPPVINNTMDKPLHFAKGTRFRQTCTWDNASAKPLIFPNEMCLSFMYYFPDRGELFCPKDADPPAP